MFKWVVLVMLLSPVLAAAQAINIRSGAHEGFARVVLDVQPNTEWRSQPIPSGMEVTLLGHTEGFDTARVFDRINRDYISQVVGEEDSVSVKFSCRCEASVFNAGPRMIVIDVSPVPLGLPEVIPTRPQDFFLANIGLDSFRFAPRPADLQQSKVEAKNSQNLNKNVGSGVGYFPSLLVQDVSRASTTIPLRTAQEQLVQGISGAATRGVLQVGPSEGPISAARSLPSIGSAQGDGKTHRQPVTTPDSSVGANISISSADNILRNSTELQVPAATENSSCSYPNYLEFIGSNRPEGFLPSIKNLRSLLYSETNLLNEAVAVELAQTYLYYGFGAEAREVLEAISDKNQNYSELKEIADILEFEFSRRTEALKELAECDSEVALWAAMVSEQMEDTQNYNIQAALRTLSELPVHLRQYIAPLLSRRLLENGDEASANTALRSLDRVMELSTPSVDLAAAMIELNQGSNLDAENRLERVVTSNAQQSAVALIKYIDSKRSTRETLEKNVADLAEAYVGQFRNDPIGAKLRDIHVLALGMSNQFGSAFEVIDQDQRQSPENQSVSSSTRSSVVEMLALSADDATFLKHIFGDVRPTLYGVEPDVVVSVASRLNALGFPAHARRILSVQPITDRNNNTKQLEAEIALELGFEHEALANLYNMETAAVVGLRAKVLHQMGDFSAASQTFMDVGEVDHANRSAWLSDNWSMFDDYSVPVFGSAAEVANTNLSRELRQGAELLGADLSIVESENARTVLNQLLASEDVNFE